MRLPVTQRILGFEGMEKLALDLGRVSADELARLRIRAEQRQKLSGH